MRLSIGSAGVLGLTDINQEYLPTTCYVLLGDRCDNDCAFCSQKISSSRLSRIEWPEFDDNLVIERINSSDFKRVCLQCTSVGINEVSTVVKRIQKPVSVSYNFLNIEDMKKIEADICIPLDVANKELYRKIKKDSFEKKVVLIEEAAERFPGRISTHLIAGLGETYDEITNLFRHMYSIGVSVGLFAFTPIKGTQLQARKPPSLEYYRKVQAEHYRLKHKTDKVERVAFETSGCENCNRPYYNERPSGPIFNYPRPLTEEEYNEAMALINR